MLTSCGAGNMRSESEKKESSRGSSVLPSKCCWSTWSLFWQQSGIKGIPALEYIRSGKPAIWESEIRAGHNRQNTMRKMRSVRSAAGQRL